MDIYVEGGIHVLYMIFDCLARKSGIIQLPMGYFRSKTYSTIFESPYRSGRNIIMKTVNQHYMKD